MPEMLNKKKERPAEWALALLGRCEYACLGLTDEAQPYCVPVSHVLVDGCVYFHSNPRGYKAELLAQNPRVCLTAVADVHAIPMRFTTEYSSAIAFGTARLVHDPAERRRALSAICEKYAASNPHREKCAANAGNHKQGRALSSQHCQSGRFLHHNARGDRAAPTLPLYSIAALWRSDSH